MTSPTGRCKRRCPDSRGQAGGQSGGLDAPMTVWDVPAEHQDSWVPNAFCRGTEERASLLGACPWGRLRAGGGLAAVALDVGGAVVS